MGLWAAPVALARDAVVRSFDGTPIVTHFFPAEGLAAGARAPTVLAGHGWGGSGETNGGGGGRTDTTGFIAVGDLRRAGWNVLTWDARGFGGSGGEAHVDSAQFEARDVMALIDHVARQPEVTLDGAGDPRLGMVGSSYGGGIQLVTAPLDRRIDVIVPDIAWHSLRTSLYKDRAAKFGWGAILAVGGAGAVIGGVGGPAGPQTGSIDPNLVRAVTEVATTGQISAETQALFDGSEPMVERIRIPTLLTQGTVDTLFTLEEAIANYTVLRRNRVPVKMMWHCSGHGACTFEAGESGHVERAVIRWLRRWLDRDRSIDTGPRFEWLDTGGEWRGSDDYPLLPGAPLVGEGGTGATLPINAATQSGTPIIALPSPVAVNVPIGAPAAAVNAVGEPKLKLTYRGSALTAGTFVYAQIVQRETGKVLGNQATPIPIVLDDRQRTVQRRLEAVAARVAPGEQLDLQLVGGTLLYQPARTAGNLTVASARIELPTGEPVPARRVTLAVGRVSRKTSAARVRRGDGRLRVRVCARGGPAHRVRVRVLDRRGRTVARSGRFDLDGCRRVAVRRWRAARPGRYKLIATGLDDDERALRGTRAFRLRR